MQHEWGAHGKCAGAESARDFFNTICKLASAPLDLMSQHHANGEFLGMATMYKSIIPHHPQVHEHATWNVPRVLRHAQGALNKQLFLLTIV